jgi:protein SCO1/2
MYRIIFFFFSLLFMFSSAISGDVVTQTNKLPDLSDQQLGGDFTLYSSQGEFSLQQLRGKVVLLYFGYTKCPDVCPTSLAVISEALNELSSEELKSVQSVFVSVDPERDTFKVLDEYVSYFHPNILGVTGSASEIAQVAKRYGVEYRKVELEGSAFGYAVDHSTVTYLLTPEGDLRYLLAHQTPSFVILEAIRYVLGGER